MARVRVIQVVEAMIGGVRRHVLDLARGLPSDRFDVALAASPRRDPEGFAADVADLEAAGVPAHAIRMTREPSPAADSRALAALVKLFRRERYDLVHCHSSKAGVLGRMAAEAARIPARVYTPHVFAFEAGVGGSVARRAYLAAERALARRTTRLIALTRSEKDRALERGVGAPDIWRVVPNGIELPPATGSWDEGLAAELGVEPGDFVVGAAGRLAPQKGLEVLVEAARLVAVPAKVVIFGRGELEGHLRRSIGGFGLARSVVLAGERRDMDNAYAVMDVLALPSLWEGFPYVALEAMGRGMPIVASRLPSLEEVVPDGEAGILFEPGDAGDLARSIERLAAEPDLREALGREGRRLVAERYTVERMIEGTGGVYEEAIAAAGGRKT